MSGKEDYVYSEGATAPGYLTNHGARLFNRLVDKDLRPHGLSLALVGPLLILWWKGEMLQRDLVNASAVKQPAMVALLTKLESLDLIERKVNSSDRRAAQIRLTDKGRTSAVLARDVLKRSNARGLDGFSPEEAAQLAALLQRLVSNFEQAELSYQA